MDQGQFCTSEAVGRFATEKGKRLWLRTVVVPGINDTEAVRLPHAEYTKQFKFEKYELLAFHTMGFFKYEESGIENPLKDYKALDKGRLNELQEYLNNKIKELK